MEFLPDNQRQAILAHEEGHLHYRHALKRLMWVISFRAVLSPKAFFEMCEAQELEADRYAVRQGHRAGLIAFLFKHNLHVKSPGYPTNKARLEAIHG